MKESGKGFWLAAGLLLTITCFAHFWKIGLVPAGLYGDECSIAYNAYSIAETGADEYGTRYPLFFRGFDNYHDPVMVYTLVPLVSMFGLEEWAVRLPSAIFHILASVMFALLVQQHCRNKWISLAGGFVFSVIPWVLPVSRTNSAGYTPMLLGMTAGWLWLLKAFGQKSHCYAAAAGFAWAFAMYAHHTGRPMTALLLIGFALCFNRLLLSRWRIGLTFAVSYVAALIPMIIWALRAPQALTERFQTISIFQDHPSLPVVLGRFGSRFLEYFSPRFLFLSGDPIPRHHTGFGGELSWFLAPLIIAGLYAAIRFFRRRPQYRFLVLGTLIYPIAASLTTDRMHSMRCVNGVIFWLLLAAVGAQWLWQKKVIWQKLLLVVLCAGTIEISLYVHSYFGQRYQDFCRPYFQGELAEALKYCFQLLGKDERLYISTSAFSPHKSIIDAKLKPFLYAYVLFYGKIDPRQFQQAGLPESIRLYDPDEQLQPGLVLRCNFFYLPNNDPQWVPNAEPVPDGTVLLKTIPFATVLLKTIPFADSGLQYDILRLP
jgi:4-amino-4-deoxy-L-arabinose transferase-like glycosyltransferase